MRRGEEYDDRGTLSYKGFVMKNLLVLPLLAILGLQVSCTSDAERREQREEAVEKLEKAEKNGEEIKVDRDIFGDDEIEIE